jgi:hypothetical protein
MQPNLTRIAKPNLDRHCDQQAKLGQALRSTANGRQMGGKWAANGRQMGGK